MRVHKSNGEGPDPELIEDVFAEIAFRRIFGLAIEADATGRFVGSGDYFDAVVNGRTVRIIRTPDPKGSLIVPCEEAFRKHADYYALMVGKGREWEYKGVIAAKDLFTPEHLRPIQASEAIPGEQAE